MPKTEVCPNCSKSIDLAPILRNQSPIRALVKPAKWVKLFRMVENYDQIICPHCQQRYQTNKARFFWVVNPKYMAYFILIVPIVFIVLAVFRLMKDIGFIG